LDHRRNVGSWPVSAASFFYERIAKQIIAAASKGERDPVRLRNAGLAGLESKAGWIPRSIRAALLLPASL
jgi:hypothetical protein